MGHSRAYPVFRTADAPEAYRLAKRLCGFLEWIDDEFWVGAEPRTAEEARRVAAAVPGAAVDYAVARTDPVTGDYLHCDFDDVAIADDATLSAALPLSMSAWCPRGRLEQSFFNALGAMSASMDWHGRWPEDPESGTGGSQQYDGVQVVFHSDDPDLARRTGDHTVFVHVDRRMNPDRVRKLVEPAGAEVLGAPRIGW
ncbi:hypothetical protein M5362_32835 [Streptomyces sp. Je 1-79]|uniref:hypothetical protein n=1 Tax=Streptomyces sp. Je 1-79 TaxID=2943847 RepID=UPI0021A629CB|nr:hypothetical protein [Streptomyces sp. Je 1-79]MCT4357886.1 hypothetical protein [Streptomyces sp. Je 1-79]